MLFRSCAVAALALSVFAGAGGLAPSASAQAGLDPRDRADVLLVQADQTDDAAQAIGPLLNALGLDELLPILQAEGLAYAEGLEDEMFPGRANARWQAGLARIYDLQRMTDLMASEMAGRLPAETIDPLMAFFTSDAGKRIVQLEVSAREAMMDDAIEEASRSRVAEMRTDEDPRLDLLTQFVTINDLVEMNLAGALNSNLAFYRGLMDGDAFDGTLTEDEMLADVWEQAEDIRLDTADWLYAYLALAYQPLEDATLEAYIELAQAPEGVALNSALFASFDVLFTRMSRELGQAAARMMAGEDI